MPRQTIICKVCGLRVARVASNGRTKVEIDGKEFAAACMTAKGRSDFDLDCPNLHEAIESDRLDPGN